MAFLLRVELPDVPGSLGALASALGGAGADIEAIEIVEHRSDGVAVDDVLLELPSRLMPDALITACHELDGVQVHWISRYNAGASLSMDLEAVETFTQEPAKALEHLVSVVPPTFRTDWAMALRARRRRAGDDATPARPPRRSRARRCRRGRHVVAGAPHVSHRARASTPGTPRCWRRAPARLRDGTRFVVVVGRHGGPEFLSSEVARLGHMVSLAASVQKS